MKTRITLSVLAAFIMLPLVAQEAKIIIIEKNDSASLKASYAEYKGALERWEKVKSSVAKKYTVENGKVMEGWEKVEFSVDFRALVPQRSYSSSLWNSGGNLVLTGTTTTIPASSTMLSDDVGVREDLKVREK